MRSSLRALAVAVDGLCAQGLATVTETPSALTVSALRAAEAQNLLPLLTQLSWPFTTIDNAGEHAVATALTADYEPFVITLDKPIDDAGLLVLTKAGFRAFLLDERSDETWHVAMLTTGFATTAASFLALGATGIFSAATPTKSPRELVTEFNARRQTPSDIRAWLLQGHAGQDLWDEPVFRTFADLSAQALMKALAGEIKSDGGLVFKGPPYTHLEPPADGAADDLEREGYNSLRDAAAWVYENAVEAEQRHGLFVAEFGASHPPIATASLAFKRVVTSVLQGARLAYQLSLSDLTREAIKAQADLKRAVADDTAKLADNTRQVATAVAASLATCVGLIAAKVGTTTPHWVIQLIAAIAAIYVAAVTASGWVFMDVQQDMRRKWRGRLYRFVPDGDYKAMVLDPSRRAEMMFKITAVAGGVISFLAVLIVFFFP